MKISVVLCTRNQPAVLRQNLDAIFNHTHGADLDYEVIVVDNASTDMTRLMVAEYLSSLPSHAYGRLRYCHESHLGYSHARNTAIRVAQGDVVVFVEDGICPDAKWLEEISSEFAAAPALQMLIGGVASAGNEIAESPILAEPRQHLSTFDTVASFLGGCFAIRRESLIGVGGFDSKLGSAAATSSIEEFDFVYRVLKSGCEILYAPNVITSKTATASLRTDWKGRLAFVRKHLMLGDWSALKVAFWALRQPPQRTENVAPELPAIEFQARVH